MKNLTFLILSIIIFCSCSSIEDDFALKTESATKVILPTRTLSLNVTRTADINVDRISIYVYLVDNKKDSLVYAKELALGDGNLQLELPLGENLQAFAVANQGSITDEDSLSTVTIHQNAEAQNEVYLSDIVSFKSDYTTDTVGLTMKRIVGEVIMQPSDTDLSSVSFDRVNATFTNMGLAYKVQSGEVGIDNITLPSTISSAWKVSAFSFPTTSVGTTTQLYLSFLKNSVEVNHSVANIDAGIVVETSKRYTISVPFLNDEYVDDSWSGVSAAKQFGISAMKYNIQITDF